jgi:parvulin-like peptidyl-prolyl isomerase
MALRFTIGKSGLFAALVACGLAPAAALAQAERVRDELLAVAALPSPGIVVATVDDKPIDSAEVNRLVKQTLRGRPASKAALSALEAQALETVISRRLINNFLDKQKFTASDAEIDKVLAERQKSLRKSDGDLADIRGQVGLTEAAYRDEIKWEVRWTKFLRKAITDETMEKYFEAHRKEYDDTELRVSHIVLRPDGDLDPEEIDRLTAQAERIRNEIVGEIITFEAAAKKYSSGPSRQKDGDLGFITRNGIMPEEFSKAAFALDKGAISTPVTTHLGVHLITCTDIKPGNKTWRDVRREIQPAVTQEVFKQLSASLRGSAKIEYTGAIAHLNPENGELVKSTTEADAAKAAIEKAGK